MPSRKDSIKSMQTAVKWTLGKGKPPKKSSVYNILLLWRRWGQEKVLSLDPGKKAPQAFLRKGNCFSVGCPLSLEALSPSLLLTGTR